MLVRPTTGSIPLSTLWRGSVLLRSLTERYNAQRDRGRGVEEERKRRRRSGEEEEEEEKRSRTDARDREGGGGGGQEKRERGRGRGSHKLLDHPQGSIRRRSLRAPSTLQAVIKREFLRGNVNLQRLGSPGRLDERRRSQ